MSVARAETELAAVLLVELMVALAEEDDRAGDEPAESAPAVAPGESIAAA